MIDRCSREGDIYEKKQTTKVQLNMLKYQRHSNTGNIHPNIKKGYLLGVCLC